MSIEEKIGVEKLSLPAKIILELTKSLDISKTMYDDAENKFKAIAKYLGESNNPLLQEAHIYPQGSMRLGTVTKPMNQDEFDLDLVIHLPNVTKEISSEHIHKIIGDRLKEHSIYKELLIPLNRGWRIDYASSFHLDITPSIHNPFGLGEEYHFVDTAEFVPDKKLQEGKDSNPRGYASWFDEIDKLIPIFSVPTFESAHIASARDYKVDDLPEYKKFKGIIKRVVQLLKRHRDVYFNEREKALTDYKPISVLVTTLAAKSYRKIIEDRIEYSCPFEMMKDIVKNMHTFIEKEYDGFYVKNPTNEKENFAEKWKTNKKYSEAFYQWQNAAYAELVKLQKPNGIDNIQKSLSESYGQSYANKVISSLNSEVEDKRSKLILAPSILVSNAATNEIKTNTFFGE